MISGEDLLSRIEGFNKLIENLRLDKGEDWDYRNEMSLVASDVVSLFPSLTVKNSAKAVRSQAEKINIEWKNVDTKWLTLYIHMNRNKSSDRSSTTM